MKTVLSTKKLTKSQKEHLLNAGLAVVDVDFIKTEVIDFECENTIENAIFTSKNGVKAVFDKSINIENVYCVGKRTEQLINDFDAKVQIFAENAEKLSNAIIENVSDKKFHYFCAKDRLNTLPNKLTEANISWKEIPVYKTQYTPKKYNQQFHGVLFYSPSGVESFFSVNTMPEHSFCIGETTAKAVKKYTKNYTVATTTTVENVLVKAIKYFKQ